MPDLGDVMVCGFDATRVRFQKLRKCASFETV